jgi:hypothetical protein
MPVGNDRAPSAELKERGEIKRPKKNQKEREQRERQRVQPVRTNENSRHHGLFHMDYSAAAQG